MSEDRADTARKTIRGRLNRSDANSASGSTIATLASGSIPRNGTENWTMQKSEALLVDGVTVRASVPIKPRPAKTRSARGFPAR